jgi:hypothetical protein
MDWIAGVQTANAAGLQFSCQVGVSRKSILVGELGSRWSVVTFPSMVAFPAVASRWFAWEINAAFKLGSLPLNGEVRRVSTRLIRLAAC